MIVPVPVPFATVAPDGELNCIVNTSVSSAVASWTVGTRIVFLSSPCSKLRVPDVVV